MAAGATYQVDATMQASIERIRLRLGAANRGEALRRSIALMLLAIDLADEGKRILILDRHGGELQRIALAG